MIRELSELGARLWAEGLCPAENWASVSLGGWIDLDLEGRVVGVDMTPARTTAPRLPARTGLTVAAAFLTGQPKYWVGGGERKAAECHAAQRELHQHVLGGVEHPAAAAVLRFLADSRGDAAAVRRAADAANGNLGVRVDGIAAHAIPALAAAWDAAPQKGADLHPGISGLKLNTVIPPRFTSTHSDAFKSYGHDKPVCPPETKPLAYAAALNWLSGKPDTIRMGGTCVMAWDHADLSTPVMQYLLPWSWWTPIKWPTGPIFVLATTSYPGRVSVKQFYKLSAADFKEKAENFNNKMKNVHGLDGYRNITYLINDINIGFNSKENECFLLSVLSMILNEQSKRQIYGTIVNKIRSYHRDFLDDHQVMGLLGAALDFPAPQK